MGIDCEDKQLTFVAMENVQPVQRCNKRDDMVKPTGQTNDLCSSMWNGHEWDKTAFVKA